MANETWVINSVPVIATRPSPIAEKNYINFDVSFTSNGVTFSRMMSNTHTTGDVLIYRDGSTATFAFNAQKGDTDPYWYNQAYRTIALDSPATGDFLTWLQANAVKQASGYTLSYSTAHGTAPSPVSDITEITSSMLPELSASGYIFGGWYYESTYTTLAQAGDTLTADTTLYAKWTVDPDYLVKGSTLTAIGDAIRGKTRGTAELSPAEMAESITEELVKPSGTVTLTQQSGTDVSQYASASVRSGSLALNTPSVSSSGLITASASLSTSGWVGSAPTSKTYQMTTQAGKTVTPSTSQQTAVASGRYTTGAVYVAGDANLIAGNIKQGVSIFGVAGSLTPGITPTGTKFITANGTYDVTEFASAAVAVPTVQNYKEFTGTIASTITGSESKFVLMTDDIISQIAQIPSVLIRLSTDFASSTPYSLLGAVAQTQHLLDAPGNIFYQFCYRVGSDGSANNRSAASLFATTNLTVGQLRIVGNQLIWYVSSANYAIRPCNYKVQIMW